MQTLRIIVAGIIFTLVTTSCITGIAQREDHGLKLLNSLKETVHEIARNTCGESVLFQQSSKEIEDAVPGDGDELDQEQP